MTKRSGFVRDLREMLAYRWFRRLFWTRITGQLADGVFQVALASYVVFSPEKQATAGKVAVAFATLLLPFTVVGPFAGVLLDRWRRQVVLVRANLLRAVLVVVVALLVAAGVTNAAFYIAALAVLSVNRFILAGLSAALPHTVDSGRLVVANAVSPTAGTIAATSGGVVGFVVHALVGKGDTGTVVILAAGAAAYVSASFVARTMPVDLLGPEDADSSSLREVLRGVVEGIAAGARHVWGRPAVARTLAAIAVSRFWYGVTTIMTLLLYRNHFNSPSDPNRGLTGFGTAVAVSGLGFLAAAIATPPITARLGLRRWIISCLVISAAAGLGFGSLFSPVPLLIGAVLLGFAAQGQKICTDTIVQRGIDDEFRGRVFSFYDMLFNGAFVLAAAFAAALLPFSGKSYTVLFVIAAGYLAAAAGYALR